MTYSHIVYSNGNKEVSFIRGAAFDKNWDEIVGKMNRYSDMKFPENVEKAYQALDKLLSFADCDSERFLNSLQREDCRTELNNNRLKKNEIEGYYVVKLFCKISIYSGYTNSFL